MQIVININQETYDYCIEHSHEYVLGEAIKNGIILPDTYGDLIDRDVLMDIYKRKVYFDFAKQVEIAKAVVKGNKM